MGVHVTSNVSREGDSDGLSQRHTTYKHKSLLSVGVSPMYTIQYT